MVYADVRVTAQCEEDLMSFLKLCSVIQAAGDKGHCSDLNVVVDGDGSGHYIFEVNGEKMPSNYDWNEKCSLWLGE